MAKKKANKKPAPAAKPGRTRTSSRLKTKSQQPTAKSAERNGDLRTYTIRDYRLEKPSFTLRQVRVGDELRYEVESGDLSRPAPPIRESKYLSRAQVIEIYRWMLLNRRMETALENLYKQGKVVGGVYFGLGQEACSCASAYALRKDEWLGPMIRNQGALLVRGFSPADIMMQYMAKAGSPTRSAGFPFSRPNSGWSAPTTTSALACWWRRSVATTRCFPQRRARWRPPPDWTRPDRLPGPR